MWSPRPVGYTFPAQTGGIFYFPWHRHQIEDNTSCMPELVFQSSDFARHIRMKTRKRIIKAYVWSILLYVCETWTITTRNMTKLQSFEMWAYRKMMKISWREKKRNEEVLTLADEQLYIIPTIKKRKITYFGHMIRRNNIHRLLLEGPLEGKRSRGRPRTEWMTNITEWTGMRYEDLVRLAQDWEPWRITTANLLKEDGT